MNFINSLSPTRKKGLVAAAILLVIALVIVVVLRLTGSSDTEHTAASRLHRPRLLRNGIEWNHPEWN